MKEIFVWIDEIQLQEYLKHFGRGPLTQDDDFLAAIWMKRFYELKLNKPFTIGFKMTTGRKEDLPDWSTAMLSDLHTVLDKMRSQDDSLDFALSEGKALDTRGSAFALQVKRFIRSREADTTDAFAGYLNDSWRKYGKRRLKLTLLVVMGGVSFDLKEVHKKLDSSKIPFSKIYFMGVKSPNVYLGEIYPSVGVERFPIEKFLP